MRRIRHTFMSLQDNSIFVITVVTAFVSLTFFFTSLYFGWFGERIEEGTIFCESMHPGLIKQPSNTWSNLGFVFVGLFVAWCLTNRWYHHNRNTLTQNKFYGTLLPCLIVLVGNGSMALHASASHMGGNFDRRSMYLFDSFMVSYAALRLFLLQHRYFVTIFFFVFGTCIWAEAQSDIHFIFYSFGNTAFVFYILAGGVLEILNIIFRKRRCKIKWLYTSGGLMIVAYFIWKMSLTGRPWCIPTAMIQGHAIWHILDALALYYLFKFYVSEDCQPKIKLPLSNV